MFDEWSQCSIKKYSDKSVDIISDDTTSFIANRKFKKEIAEQEFQAGMAVLENMNESIKHEPLSSKTYVYQ